MSGWRQPPYGGPPGPQPPGPPQGPPRPPGPPGPPGPHWGPSPGPPPPPRPPGGGGGKFAIVAVIIGCVIGLVAAVAIIQLRSSGQPQAPPTIEVPPPTATPSMRRTASPGTPTPRRTPTRTRTSEPSCPTRQVPAVVVGWQAIGSVKDGAAFDVPPDFTLDTEVVFGQEGKGEMVIAHCGTFYQQRVCGSRMSNRGSLGLVTYGSSTNRDGDPVKYAERWSRLANTDYDTGKVGPTPAPRVTTVRTASGAEATVATVEADDTTPDKNCPAPRFRVTVVGIELPNERRALLVIDLDRGTDKDLPEEVEKSIITSLRPL